MCAIPGLKTAELLYATPDWDFYYCYRCRRWFKRFFRDNRVFLPVDGKREVRFLTLIYTTRMTYICEARKQSHAVSELKGFVSRRLHHKDPANGPGHVSLSK